MNDIILAATSFPTVILTLLLGLVILYWLSVVLGAVDVDLFGAGEALDGVMDGAGEGIGEGFDGGGEANEGGESGNASDPGAISSALSALGLRRVPLTVAASLIILFSWFISMIGSHTAPMLVGETLSTWVVGPVILIIALLVALVITALAVHPLAPFFETKEAKSVHDYIGSMCTVTTGRVDSGFGHATIEEGSDALVVDVRCDIEDAAIGRGDRALIIDYDAERLAYVVEPMKQL